MSSYLFTSESVGAGHPDKMADQISDAILDEVLRKTGETIKLKKSVKEMSVEDVRCACETMVKTGMVIVAGEVRSEVMIDIEKIVRDTIKKIGYNDNGNWGFNNDECAVINVIGEQSRNIAQGVDKNKKKKIGAGDQGLMFGYACRETPSLMPLSLELSHQLMRRHAKIRNNKKRQLAWLGPDAKAQVTVRYQDKNDNSPVVEAVVLSSQHATMIDGDSVPDYTKAKNKKKEMKNLYESMVRDPIFEQIIKPIIPNAEELKENNKIYINPTGYFNIGGPVGDCGLTGRKIIVDTYGGAAPHGGGAFSGKDPTKVDRSAAYMARYIAKHLVYAKLADKCLVQLAYAIGETKPLSFMVETYGSGKMKAQELEKRVQSVFDLTPEGIIETFNLWRPIYQQTATYGHFGREEFPWEKIDTDIIGTLTA